MSFFTEDKMETVSRSLQKVDAVLSGIMSHMIINDALKIRTRSALEGEEQVY
jgi:hypothetical protein